MPSINLRNLIVIGLLIVGLLIVYTPAFFASEREVQPDLSDGIEDGTIHRYVADLDFWQKTPRETTVYANSRFDLNADLADVPMVVGNWTGREMPETNQEVMILLEPEQYVQRLYEDDQGRYIWLSMIGGRSSQPFHAPDICYDADGWQYDLGSHPIPLADGGELYGLWLSADKTKPGEETPIEHVVFYFYLFPDQERDLSQGIVLFKLTSSLYGSLDETLEMHGEFVRQFFTRAE